MLPKRAVMKSKDTGSESRFFIPEISMAQLYNAWKLRSNYSWVILIPMRKIEVMGIMLRDYSVREAMRRISTYLNNGSCNTVDFITHDTLLRASTDEDMKREIDNNIQ